MTEAKSNAVDKYYSYFCLFFICAVYQIEPFCFFKKHAPAPSIRFNLDKNFGINCSVLNFFKSQFSAGRNEVNVPRYADLISTKLCGVNKIQRFMT